MEDGVGKTLHDARRLRELDLEEVERSTKIRARFLRAIEAEDWDALPEETYARAFIRTYADFLGLQGAELVDRYRREAEVSSTPQPLPRVEPDPIAPARRRRRLPVLSPRALAVLVSVAVVAVAIVVGVTGGSGGPARMPPTDRGGGGGQQAAGEQASPLPKPNRGISLSLAASAEIWVCLLDSAGEALIDGQILGTGAQAGPFRSGSFTVSFGNGEVSMTVNGQQASIPPTSSPIGYSIGAGGELSELSEGERPTCT